MISEYIYVEPSMTSSQSVAPASSAQKLLPGFKWDPTFSTYDGLPVVTNNGYTLGKEGQKSGWTPVGSTTEYTKGKIFTKFTIKIHWYQTLGIVSRDVSNSQTFAYSMMIVCQYSTIYGFFVGKDNGDIVKKYSNWTCQVFCLDKSVWNNNNGRRFFFDSFLRFRKLKFDFNLFK